MSDFGVDVEQRDGVAWLVIRNPSRMNALRLEMWEAIPPIVARLDADPAVRVCVVRGAGSEAFASGADISEFETVRRDGPSAAAYEQSTSRAFDALLAFQKPLVAMIHGFCLGGGMAVAACADLRVGADDARFSIPAGRLGLGYEFRGIERLVRVLGPSATAEFFFTARRYTADEALRIGLLNQLRPKAELERFTEEYAVTIAGNAPLTLRAAKRAIAAASSDPDDRDMASVMGAIRACFDSGDYAEGVRAFLEKRPPRFRGA